MWETLGGYYFNAPTIDFCEENYIYSHIIAEFWNTVTSQTYLIVGIWTVLAFKSQPKYSRLVFSGYTVLLIWIGTLLFHMSMTRECQIIDELSIIYWLYSIAYIIYYEQELVLYEIYNINIVYIYVIIIIFVTYIYLFMSFELFNIHNAVIAWTTLYFFYQKIKYNKYALKYYKLGCFFYVSSIIIWGIEIEFCRKYPNQFPKWLNIHAWIWHIGSALCIYYFHYSCAYLIAQRNKHDIIQLSILKSLKIIQKK